VVKLICFEGDTASPVTLEDKSILEQNRLFNELDEDDKNTALKLLDAFLRDTKTKQAYTK
tara:strand:- start:654 stop:833 length:180 start_codon:yes stop_codon:yes gene_type:complete